MSLSPDEKHRLAAVLDAIVPPSGDGRRPGAGELGVGDSVEANLRERPALRPGLVEGLELADELAVGRGARSFAELAAPDRRAVLEETAARVPAFLGPLVLQAYAAYYRHPRVLAALGLEARPPYPEGYAVPPTDLALLAPVRRRGPFYREP